MSILEFKHKQALSGLSKLSSAGMRVHISLSFDFKISHNPLSW